MIATAVRGSYTIAVRGRDVAVRLGSRIVRAESYATADAAGATYHATVDTYTAILRRPVAP